MQNGDQLQGQRQVMPWWPSRAMLVRKIPLQMAQVTALPSLVLPPLSMLFVSSQGEGQHNSNLEAQQQAGGSPMTQITIYSLDEVLPSINTLYYLIIHVNFP